MWWWCDGRMVYAYCVRTTRNSDKRHSIVDVWSGSPLDVWASHRRRSLSSSRTCSRCLDLCVFHCNYIAKSHFLIFLQANTHTSIFSLCCRSTELNWTWTKKKWKEIEIKMKKRTLGSRKHTHTHTNLQRICAHVFCYVVATIYYFMHNARTVLYVLQWSRDICHSKR